MPGQCGRKFVEGVCSECLLHELRSLSGRLGVTP